MKNSEIISKIILCLIILGIILMSIFTIIVLFLPDDPGDQEILDSIFPEWVMRILVLIFFGAFIYIPTGGLCVLYIVLKDKRKTKHEE